MRLKLKHEHDGVYFSHNGHAAYLNGEKPAFMWPSGCDIVPTVRHHIQRKRPFGYSYELVMFYEMKNND